MPSLKHKFQSAKADGSDSTLAKPTDWNAEHDLITEADGVLLGRPTGAGPGPVQELPLSSMFLPGFIIMYPGNAPPPGWYLCDGTVRPVGDDAALLAVCANKYGGNGVTTFGVPDLRGTSPAGPGGGYGGLGYRAGAYTSATGTFTSSGTNLIDFGSPAILASGNIAQSGGQGLHNISTGGGSIAAQNGDDVSVGGSVPNLKGNMGISVSGASGAFNIVQPIVVVNFIIKR